MMPGSSGVGHWLRPRDIDEGAAGAVCLIRITDGVAVRDLTYLMGGGEPATAGQQVNQMSPAGDMLGGLKTTFLFANWDAVSINQQLVRDFKLEELNEQVGQGSEVGLFYEGKSEPGKGTQMMIRAFCSATVKLCRSVWIEVKNLDDPLIEGAPRLSHTLIEKGLILFDYQGF